MEWVPRRAWLTKIRVDALAADLRFDLAIDASGAGAPSARDAGLVPLTPTAPRPSPLPWVLLLVAVLMVPLGSTLLLAAAARTPPGGWPPARA